VNSILQNKYHVGDACVASVITFIPLRVHGAQNFISKQIEEENLLLLK
jgi:hypothetical protein